MTDLEPTRPVCPCGTVNWNESSSALLVCRNCRRIWALIDGDWIFNTDSDPSNVNEQARLIWFARVPGMTNGLIDQLLSALSAAGIAVVQRWRLGERRPTQADFPLVVCTNGAYYVARGLTDICDFPHWLEETGVTRADPSDEYVLLSDLFPEGR